MPASSVEHSLSRLELVVLARLSVAKPPSASALAKSLAGIVSWAKADVDQVLANLAAKKMIDKRRSLTTAGHRAVQAWFDMPTTPTWSTARYKLLPQLAGGDPDTLIADALGLPRQRYTMAQLRAAVLAKRIGAKPTSKRGEVRLLAIRQWVGERVTPAPTPSPPPPDLLTAVRDALHRVPEGGRFGSEKVFVSALWQDLQVADLSLDKFKSWLVSANREGQLVLVRADLPEKMNPKLVAASEIRDHNGTFHFVLDQRSNGRSVHAR